MFERTFLLGGDAIPDGTGALAEFCLGAAELSEGVGEVRYFLCDLAFDLCELGGGDGGEIDCFRRKCRGEEMVSNLFFCWRER